MPEAIEYCVKLDNVVQGIIEIMDQDKSFILIDLFDEKIGNIKF